MNWAKNINFFKTFPLTFIHSSLCVSMVGNVISYCSVGSVCILNQTSADMEIRVIYELWSFLPSFLYVSCHETRSSAKLKTGFLIFVETEAMFVLKVISLNFSSSDTRHLRGCTWTMCCFWLILHQGAEKCNLNTNIFFILLRCTSILSACFIQDTSGYVCVQCTAPYYCSVNTVKFWVRGGIGLIENSK